MPNREAGTEERCNARLGSSYCRARLETGTHRRGAGRLAHAHGDALQPRCSSAPARIAARPSPKHAVLPVEKAHFDRWLELFLATVDENFSGPKAEEAKGRALSIADTFARRMGLLPQGTVLLQP